MAHDFAVVWKCKTSKSRQCTCNDISNCSSICLTHFDIWMHKSVDCSVHQGRIIASINTVNCENGPVGAMVKPCSGKSILRHSEDGKPTMMMK